MNVIRRRLQPNASTNALKGICHHNQRHLHPPRKAFAYKIHALQGICPPRSTVTWRFCSTFYSMITPKLLNRVRWVFPFSCTNYSSDFALTPAWMSYIADCDHTASSLSGICECQEPQLPPQPARVSPSTCTPFKDCPWIQTSTFSPSHGPDPTSLYNMRVGELLKKDLGHMRQFQGKIMSDRDGMGS